MGTPGVTFESNTGDAFLYAGLAWYGCLGLATDMVDGDSSGLSVSVSPGAGVIMHAVEWRQDS